MSTFLSPTASIKSARNMLRMPHVTPLKTNMTMEKLPFQDVSPIKHMVIFQPVMVVLPVGCKRGKVKEWNLTTTGGQFGPKTASSAKRFVSPAHWVVKNGGDTRLHRLEDHPRTDGYVVSNHGDGKSSKYSVVPLPNGRFITYKLGVILTTYKSWDAPPSRPALTLTWCH